VKLVQRLAQLGTLSRRGAALELAERGEFVDMAIRQGTRLKEPIEQLLLAARFEQTGRERVFERFTQLDSGATRRAGGSASASTSPVSWPTPRAASCSAATRSRPARAPASSCASPWPPWTSPNS
jgi:hypothetical protein